MKDWKRVSLILKILKQNVYAYKFYIEIMYVSLK